MSAQDFLDWLEAEGADRSVGTRVEVTRFGSIRTPRGRTDAVEPRIFVAHPRDHAGPKDALPLVSFATFEGESRKLANVRDVTALALDVDEPTSPGRLFSAVERLEVRTHVHSTFSARLDAWKWRVILEIDRTIAPAEHRALWRVATAALARLGVTVDRACSDASRAFFVPARRPGGPYVSRSFDAPPIDVADSLAFSAELARPEVEPRPSTRPRTPTDTFSRATAYARKVPGAISGAQGHRETFKLAAKLVLGFELSDAQALEILTEWNATCRPPWSAPELARKVKQARTNGYLPDGFLLGAA